MMKTEILLEIKKAENEAKKIAEEAQERKQKIISDAKKKAMKIIQEAESSEEVSKFITKSMAEIEIEKKQRLKEGLRKVEKLRRKALKNIKKASKILVREYERYIDAQVSKDE
ncbi:MAG: hypothetical protein ACE5K0_12660 [Candidatus Methanofastidiosia archaeon]